EDTSHASPIATLFYEFYDDIEVLTQQLAADTEQIQCLVAKTDRAGFVAFGQTQQPQLWNYADKVDTIQFLTKL
ncbi:MAG: acyl-CoA reductase, partial [Lutibacter sp.]|nr:acyl-CoA reductase [Lutibacter sp.]